MNKTKIEWVKNPDGTQGYTWNPITGCLNHTPEGLCLGGLFPCYAYKLANGRLKPLYLANENLAGGYRLARGVLREDAISPNLNPFYPRFWEERLNDPICLPSSHRPPAPKGIFPCDMSDLFGIGIPEEWTRRVLDVIQATPYNRYYLLTKQPQNLIKFSPFPDNCWVGVTATDDEMFWNACRWLYKIQAKVKYISIEPHLGQIRVGSPTLSKFGINWIIDGAQTKPYKPPKIEWVEEIVRAADRAGVKVFLKDNLVPLLNEAGWRNDLLWGNSTGKPRQEIPE